ncbi:MAG: hypothetical protein JOZ54_05695 [Acidobacteria bacterium]|nr:hypothetical protein [Acidobacteriota bacterium]
MSLRVASSLAAAAALFAVAPQATPIDRALPFVGLVVALIAMLADRWTPAILAALPLLAVAAVAIGDESQRLLAYGLIVGLAFAATLLVAELNRPRAVAIVVAALLLLRWIPPTHVVRELLVMLGALAIVWAGGGRTIVVAVAIGAALVTPAIPLRTVALPFVVAAIVLFVKPRLPAIVGATLVALMLTFFPWSGVLARGMSLLPLIPRAERPRHGVHIALAPGQSTTLDVPYNLHWLVLSASNASRLKRGTLLGHLENRPIRVGDVADWGAIRREHFYASRNPLPADPAGKLRAYGYEAWIDLAGRVPLPANAKKITVRAESGLHEDVRLQIEAFE